jgi:Protein of unknown function (DUF2397)
VQRAAEPQVRQLFPKGLQAVPTDPPGEGPRTTPRRSWAATCVGNVATAAPDIIPLGVAHTDEHSVQSGADGILIDERLDLLRWVAAPERNLYLVILGVFDAAKAGYDIQLRPNDVLAALAATGAEVDPVGLGRHLDSLHQWRVLERSFDASRVSSIEEYRRRRPVFQFTELGERAYSGVRQLLDVQPGQGRLQRFALREIAEQLDVLCQAEVVADGERALAALNRIDLVLTQLTDLAGQFYVLVGVMTQEVEVNAGRFVEMKDLLLGHLYEFLQDLHRWTPIVQQGITGVEALGTDQMLRRVADIGVHCVGHKLRCGFCRSVFEKAHRVLQSHMLQGYSTARI